MKILDVLSARKEVKHGQEDMKVIMKREGNAHLALEVIFHKVVKSR
jgi:hypothetical protein